MNNLLHKLYGTTPGGDGLQPKEALAYGIAGFGQNFVCTIIGSYLTIFLTDALLFGAEGVTIGKIAKGKGGWITLIVQAIDYVTGAVNRRIEWENQQTINNIEAERASNQSASKVKVSKLHMAKPPFIDFRDCTDRCICFKMYM